jgi:hypothetical protein
VWQRPHCPDWLYLPETPFLLQALMLHGPTLRLSSMISVVASLLLTLRGFLRSRAALHVELLALRHQLSVLERLRRRRLRLRHADRLLWVSIFPSVDPTADRARHRQTRDGHRLASPRVPRVLDVEEPSPSRPPNRAAGTSAP